jgi:hypothetical protein
MLNHVSRIPVPVQCTLLYNNQKSLSSSTLHRQFCTKIVQRPSYLPLHRCTNPLPPTFYIPGKGGFIPNRAGESGPVEKDCVICNFCIEQTCCITDIQRERERERGKGGFTTATQLGGRFWFCRIILKLARSGYSKSSLDFLNSFDIKFRPLGSPLDPFL